MGIETTARERGREEEERKISVRFLVRALKSGWEDREEDDDSGLKYKRVEFHMLNLDVDLDHLKRSSSSNDDGDMIELRRDVLPSLFARTNGGVLISLDLSSFSVFGGLSLTIDESLVASLKPPPERRHLYYKGAATINLGDANWEAFHLQSDKYNAQVTACAVLSGKLYNFGSVTLSPELFDPSLGYWTPLRFPPHLRSFAPSVPVVADPCNHRILIHFRRPLDHLYAFYPPGDGDSDSGRWERLKPDYLAWTEVVAVEGDLLFVYYKSLKMFVYDLASPSGDKLDVVWSSSMCGRINLAHLAFTSLFSLGNGFMCFADSVSKPPPDNISLILLLIFTVHRHSSTSILLTPISFHYKIIESTSKVLDFLPLSQEASEILGRKLANNNVVQ